MQFKTNLRSIVKDIILLIIALCLMAFYQEGLDPGFLFIIFAVLIVIGYFLISYRLCFVEIKNDIIFIAKGFKRFPIKKHNFPISEIKQINIFRPQNPITKIRIGFIRPFNQLQIVYKDLSGKLHRGVDIHLNYMENSGHLIKYLFNATNGKKTFNSRIISETELSQYFKVVKSK